MSGSKEVWREACMDSSKTIRNAIERLNYVSIKIILIVGSNGKLEGTLSDGDIRRGLVNGLSLDSQIKPIVNYSPFVVPPSMDQANISRLMMVNKVQQIPIVDEQFTLIGLHIWDQLGVLNVRPNKVVIMAGGMGMRMRPHTEDCPKPMLLVAGKPMLEHILNRAVLEGFNQFIISINYLGHLIEDYFGNGEKFGVDIKYLRESSPLGTAGALSLLNPPPDIPILVTNGDVITDVSYGAVLDFHVRNSGSATIAVRQYEWQHPFGVVKIEGLQVAGFEEKPCYRSYINTGVYALNPDVFTYLKHGQPCDMPELLEKLRMKNKNVLAYPMHEPWMDVGRPSDLALANSNFIA